MSSVEQTFEERMEEELAKINPETLQYLEQLLEENEPGVKIVKNALDEPISQETEKRLQPRPPPRQRKARKTQELLRRYDPYPAQNIRTVTDYQNEILDLFDDARHEGEESKKRRYIRWRVIRDLEKDLTPNFMEKIRGNVTTSFYIRHVFSYQLSNIEDGTVIVYYTNHGSRWINKLKRWKNGCVKRRRNCLDSDKIRRLSTKVVLDGEPLLGAGALPD